MTYYCNVIDCNSIGKKGYLFIKKKYYNNIKGKIDKIIYVQIMNFYGL